MVGVRDPERDMLAPGCEWWTGPGPWRRLRLDLAAAVAAAAVTRGGVMLENPIIENPIIPRSVGTKTGLNWPQADNGEHRSGPKRKIHHIGSFST